MICPIDSQPCTMDGSETCRQSCIALKALRQLTFMKIRIQWVRDEHRRLCRDIEDIRLRRAELERDVIEFKLEAVLEECDRIYNPF